MEGKVNGSYQIRPFRTLRAMIPLGQILGDVFQLKREEKVKETWSTRESRQRRKANGTHRGPFRTLCATIARAKISRHLSPVVRTALKHSRTGTKGKGKRNVSRSISDTLHRRNWSKDLATSSGDNPQTEVRFEYLEIDARVPRLAKRFSRSMRQKFRHVRNTQDSKYRKMINGSHRGPFRVFSSIDATKISKR